MARQIRDPWPLPVRWKVTARAEAVMANWAAVVGASAPSPIALDGAYEQVADVFTAPASPRRLVVLGDPGAGKSTPVPPACPRPAWPPDCDRPGPGPAVGRYLEPRAAVG